MLGYAPGELVGCSVRQLVHPDHQQAFGAVLQNLQTGLRSCYEVTRVFRHKTGRPVPLQCTVSFLPATAHRPARIARLHVDLTPRVSAVRALVTAERDRERVLAAATDAFIALDQAGVVQEWNAAAERIFGYPAEQAVGRLLASLIVPQDQREAHAAGLRRVAAGGASTLVGHSTEMVGLHRDGHLVQIELTPWRVVSEDGTDNYYAFCRDIEERVAARAALVEANEGLRRGQAQLQAAFEASLSADAVVDGAGRLVDVNPQLCRFLDRSREQLVQLPFTDFVFAPDVVAAECALTQAGAPARERTELRFTTGDGRVVWGLASVTPMEDGPDGSRAILRIENLQAFKELESALARQSSYDAMTGCRTAGCSSNAYVRHSSRLTPLPRSPSWSCASMACAS